MGTDLAPPSQTPLMQPPGSGKRVLFRGLWCRDLGPRGTSLWFGSVTCLPDRIANVKEPGLLEKTPSRGPSLKGWWERGGDSGSFRRRLHWGSEG